MPSRLASALLRLPRSSGKIGDILWRHANLEEVEAVGCAPSEQLLDEYALVLSGDPARQFAVRVPDSGLLDKLAGSPVSDLRLGVAENKYTSDATLAVLATDTADAVKGAAVSAQTARSDARNAALSTTEPSATDLLELLDIEGIETVMQSQPLVVIAGLVRNRNAGETLARIRGAKPELYGQIMLEWATSESPFTAEVAEWLTASDLRMDTLLPNVNQASLRRRSTAAAVAVFMNAGYIPQPSSVSSHASLEQMMLVLGPAELAGMLVGSDTPVDETVMDRILIKAAPTMVANFFTGMATRKPRVGDITRLLASADIDTRTVWSEQVAKQTIDFEALAHAPWAGELLLLGKLEWLNGLPLSAVEALDEVLQERLGDDDAAWELAVVLAEEWETTLFDLLDTAVAMETEQS